MKKIIYIMGAGRSGTTLMDIMLGNNPGIFSAGELNRFSEENGTPLNVDLESKTAVFWRNFKLRLPADWQNDGFKSIHRSCKSFEYHTGLLRTWFPVHNKSFRQYRSYINTFFETLSSLVEQPILVDSSKYPMRGYFMAEILKYEMAFIYIKRNPLDVVKSFKKKDVEQPSKGWLGTNIYLLIVNLICMYTLKKLKKKHAVITIHYDDLISSPVKALTDIGNHLQVDVSQSLELAAFNRSFKPGLLFDGNRIRLEQEIYLSVGNNMSKPSGIKDHLTLLLQSIWWN